MQFKNKHFIFLLLIFFLSANSPEGSAGDNESGSGTVSTGDKSFENLSLYSSGLYYKSIQDYQKAIKDFLKAAESQTEMHRIYYQLSECYYYLQDYETAVNYSMLSIKADKKFKDPYELLYRIYMTLGNYAKAAGALESLVEVNPELINIHYSLGVFYYNQLKDYDKALVSFGKIIELANTMPVDDYYKENAHFYIGRIYFSRKLIERSMEHLKKVVEINPDNDIANYILSSILMDSYEIAEAWKYISAYLSRAPDNLIMNACMGRIYYLREDPAAKTYLRKGSSGNSVLSSLSGGLYRELLQRDDEAEAILKEIINQDPMLITPHLALAKISLRKKDNKAALSEFFTAGMLMYRVKLYEEAMRNFMRVLSIDGSIPEVYSYIGKIYEETGCYNLAVLYLIEANKLNPEIDTSIHIGYIFSQLNNFSESTRYIDMAIASDPKNPRPYFFKGLAFSRRNDFPEAEKYIRKAITLEEDDTYYFYLATVLEKQNKYNETIEILKKAIEYNPENAMAYNYLGYLYADRNINLDESISLIEKALLLSPFNGAYLDSLGWAFYRKGDLELALKRLLQAEEQLDKSKTPDPVVFDHIGDTYKKIGDKGKAVQYWEKSLNLKEDPVIREKINIMNSQIK